MRILGIDPGATTGWCAYDTDRRCVVASGQFPEHAIDSEWFGIVSQVGMTNFVVVERPKGYGPTRPQMVDCGYITGRLVQWFICAREMTAELERREVKKILTEATQRDVVVTDDATAWAALKLLHGGDECAKKGGALHGVKAHERAALAVAVAWALRQASALPSPRHDPAVP
jgi:hypothetical protein